MKLCHAILTCLGVKGVGYVASNDGDGLRQEKAREGGIFVGRRKRVVLGTV